MLPPNISETLIVLNGVATTGGRCFCSVSVYEARRNRYHVDPAKVGTVKPPYWRKQEQERQDVNFSR